MKMPKIKNTHYEYLGYGQQMAYCDLEVYDLADGHTLAIVTELDDNPGTSITNRAEGIFTQLMQVFNLDKPEKLVQIEHYRKDSVLPEHWHRVTCASYDPGLKQYLNPEWEPLSYQEVQGLINS